jgi:F0F1-type ATP synthase membrane subunit b/b'
MHLPPDWGTFALLIVSFLIFWFIFGALFFKPFLRLIGDRERRFRDLNERTERLLGEQRSIVAQRARELAEVTREALVRRETQVREAQDRATQLLAAARADARAELEKVRTEIATDFAAAAREIELLARSLATELATRVLDRPITNDGQGRLNS